MLTFKKYKYVFLHICKLEKIYESYEILPSGIEKSYESRLEQFMNLMNSG